LVAGSAAAAPKTKTHRRLPAMGVEISGLVSIQSPSAGAILMMALRHTASIGRAACFGVQFILAVTDFIVSTRAL
jgi:hypothetical protein